MVRSKNKPKTCVSAQNIKPGTSHQDHSNKKNTRRNVKRRKRKSVPKYPIEQLMQTNIDDSPRPPVNSSENVFGKINNRRSLHSTSTSTAVLSENKVLLRGIERNEIKEKIKKLAIFNKIPEVIIKDLSIKVANPNPKNDPLPHAVIKEKNIPVHKNSANSMTSKNGTSHNLNLPNCGELIDVSSNYALRKRNMLINELPSKSMHETMLSKKRSSNVKTSTDNLHSNMSEKSFSTKMKHFINVLPINSVSITTLPCNNLPGNKLVAAVISKENLLKNNLPRSTITINELPNNVLVKDLSVKMPYKTILDSNEASAMDLTLDNLSNSRILPSISIHTLSTKKSSPDKINLDNYHFKNPTTKFLAKKKQTHKELFNGLIHVKNLPKNDSPESNLHATFMSKTNGSKKESSNNIINRDILSPKVTIKDLPTNNLPNNELSLNKASPKDSTFNNLTSKKSDKGRATIRKLPSPLSNEEVSIRKLSRSELISSDTPVMILNYTSVDYKNFQGHSPSAKKLYEEDVLNSKENIENLPLNAPSKDLQWKNKSSQNEIYSSDKASVVNLTIKNSIGNQLMAGVTHENNLCKQKSSNSRMNIQNLPSDKPAQSFSVEMKLHNELSNHKVSIKSLPASNSIESNSLANVIPTNNLSKENLSNSKQNIENLPLNAFSKDLQGKKKLSKNKIHNSDKASVINLTVKNSIGNKLMARVTHENNLCKQKSSNIRMNAKNLPSNKPAQNFSVQMKPHKNEVSSCKVSIKSLPTSNSTISNSLTNVIPINNLHNKESRNSSINLNNLANKSNKDLPGKMSDKIKLSEKSVSVKDLTINNLPNCELPHILHSYHLFDKKTTRKRSLNSRSPANSIPSPANFSKKKSKKNLIIDKHSTDTVTKNLPTKNQLQNELINENLATNILHSDNLSSMNAFIDSSEKRNILSRALPTSKPSKNNIGQTFPDNPLTKSQRKRANASERARNTIKPKPNLTRKKYVKTKNNAYLDTNNWSRKTLRKTKTRQRTPKEKFYARYYELPIDTRTWPHKSTSALSLYEKIEIHNGCLLLVDYNTNLFIEGVCVVRLLCGAARIDGADLKLLEECKIFSINDKLITIHTYNPINRSKICKDYILKHKIPCTISQNDIACILEITPIRDPIRPLLTSCNIEYVWNSQPKQIRTILENEQFQIKIIDSWEENISNIIHKNLETVFVYSQMWANKFKYIAFLINSFLSRTKKNIYLLDCDMSRSIYTSYTQIALYAVKEFVLGYDYLKVPSPLLSTFIGNSKPMFQSISYLNGVRFLKFAYDTRFKSEDSILIINGTDTKNCLVGLVDDAIRIIQPDISIMIEDKAGRYSFRGIYKQGLLTCLENGATAKYLMKFNEIASKALKKISKKLELPNYSNSNLNNKVYDQRLMYHRIHEIQNSTNEKNSKSKANTIPNKSTHLQILPLFESQIICPKSLKHRMVFENIKLLSSFVNCPKVGTKCHEYNYLSTLVPYKIKLSSITFSFFGANLNQKLLKFAFSSNIVGLLYDPEANEYSTQTILVDDLFTIKYYKHSYFAQCIGIGFIRNIDALNGFLYLVTPLTITSLKKFNVLAIGNHCIPKGLLKMERFFDLVNKDFRF